MRLRCRSKTRIWSLTLPARIWALMLPVCLLAADSHVLRVCADPNNLPFSNEQGQGFENKLAELVASKLGDALEYTWWAERKSFVKNSLEAGRCDVIMGLPEGIDSAETTNPYYRSSYVFVSRRSDALHIDSLRDPRLARLRIGMHIVGEDYAPPAFVLARRGITQNISGYSLFGAYGEANPAGKIIEAVDRGEIDIAIVWGPFAGYFAKSATNPLDVVPVTPSTDLGIPLAYDIAMGVRKGDTALRAHLNEVIQGDAIEIQNILQQYGIPEVH